MGNLLNVGQAKEESEIAKRSRINRGILLQKEKEKLKLEEKYFLEEFYKSLSTENLKIENEIEQVVEKGRNQVFYCNYSYPNSYYDLTTFQDRIRFRMMNEQIVKLPPGASFIREDSILYCTYSIVW